jgi:hypothetical protein
VTARNVPIAWENQRWNRQSKTQRSEPAVQAFSRRAGSIVSGSPHSWQKMVGGAAARSLARPRFSGGICLDGCDESRFSQLHCIPQQQPCRFSLAPARRQQAWTAADGALDRDDPWRQQQQAQPPLGGCPSSVGAPTTAVCLACPAQQQRPPVNPWWGTEAASSQTCVLVAISRRYMSDLVLIFDGANSHRRPGTVSALRDKGLRPNATAAQ